MGDSKKSAKKVVHPKGLKSNMKKSLPLDKTLLRTMYKFMVKSRVLEERLINIYKMGEAFFWIGAPGEEAFSVPLGMLVNKGSGLDNDWLHMHYRCSPTLIAMGMPMIDSIRLIMNKATDKNTGGRNFSNHFCYPKWNVAPVGSPIEVQYSQALGTAWVQKRENAKGITVVTGGDAGTAEGDFASSLIWSSRPNKELPMLITVQNNEWGISTNYNSQHGEQYIADRGKAFGIRTAVINGNDPIESYLRIKEEMEYIRKKQKPVLMEVMVSRLYGHSSASGANFHPEEECCISTFEEKLLAHDIIKESEIKQIKKDFNDESKSIWEQVRKEAVPTAESVWDHVFVNNENADWRKF